MYYVNIKYAYSFGQALSLADDIVTDYLDL